MKRKILTIAAGLSIITVLVMGSQIGGDTKKASANQNPDKTVSTASTAATDGTTAPTNTVQSSEPTSTKTNSSVKSTATGAPDDTSTPTVSKTPAEICAAAESSIQQIQDSYVVPNQQLQDDITTNKNILMNISSGTATRGGVVTPDEQAQVNQANSLYQLDKDLLTANMQKMNKQLIPYQQQVTDNCN
jgi:hypothetical protein